MRKNVANDTKMLLFCTYCQLFYITSESLVIFDFSLFFLQKLFFFDLEKKNFFFASDIVSDSRASLVTH
jgi:hypothetical protein